MNDSPPGMAMLLQEFQRIRVPLPSYQAEGTTRPSMVLPGYQSLWDPVKTEDLHTHVPKNILYCLPLRELLPEPITNLEEAENELRHRYYWTTEKVDFSTPARLDFARKWQQDSLMQRIMHLDIQEKREEMNIGWTQPTMVGVAPRRIPYSSRKEEVDIGGWPGVRILGSEWVCDMNMFGLNFFHLQLNRY